MRKNYFPATLVCCFLLAGFWLTQSSGLSGNRDFKSDPGKHHDAPAEAFVEWQKWEFDLLKDPATGRIPEGIFAAELAQAMITPKWDDGMNAYAKTTSHGAWAVKGPTNLGGRTRDLAIS